MRKPTIHHAIFALLSGAAITFPVTASSAPSVSAHNPQKIIIDSDFNTFDDDGQVLVMAAQAQAAGDIKLLGLTLVTGNHWLQQEEMDALRAVERLGLAQDVPVYSGSRYPLLHSYRSLEQEKALFGVADGYWGAWALPEPRTRSDLALPIDGEAQTVRLQSKHAVDVIIDAVRQSPHEITILAIGPLTNLALAIRKSPDIVPLIGRIVIMGGAFGALGNTTPGAEFNIWFDPEAAKIVMREPIDKVIIPLDVTNTFAADQKLFQQMIERGAPVLRILYSMSSYSKFFKDNPGMTAHFYDQLAFAYVVDPTFALTSVDRWIDVDTEFGLNYGRTMAYQNVLPGNTYLTKAKIVTAFDLDRFRRYFLATMTRPIRPPVAMPIAGPSN